MAGTIYPEFERDKPAELVSGKMLKLLVPVEVYMRQYRSTP